MLKNNKQQTNNINTIVIWRIFLAMSLIAAIVWLGIPNQNVNAGTNGSAIENWQMFADSASQPDITKPMKMPARSFSEVFTNAAKKADISTAKVKNGSATTKTNNATAATPAEYGILNVEFRDLASRSAVFTDLKKSNITGAFVLTTTDRFADVFVQTDAAWSAIEKNPGVVRAELADYVTVPPPPEAKVGQIAQAAPDKIVRGGYKDASGKLLTGKGVVIAIVDTGVDFRHPDFITYDSTGKPTSRLLALWDTSLEYQPGLGSKAPYSYPNGTSIGTVFTQNQLTAELRSNTVKIPATDLVGHGTACASVAAGNGNGDTMKRPEIVGVAPNADIIAVRLGKDGLENSWTINAISEWLDKTAGAKPMIFSGSFGGHSTGHDGQSIEERHLNARFPLNRAGRALVLAAGNEGNDAIHAETTFGGIADKKLISWNARSKTIIRFYFDNNDSNVRIASAGVTPVTAETVAWDLNPLTNQYSATLTVPEGAGGVYLFNQAGKQTTAHAYIGNRSRGSFDSSVAKYNTLVGSPGTADNAITVGSYDWNSNFFLRGQSNVTTMNSVCLSTDGNVMTISIGWLSCYSSPGPRRDGKRKPEIVSPGQWYTSSFAKVPGGGNLVEEWDVDSTGNYVAMNGTSAATPYTSGIIALMFEKQPALTLEQVKRLLVSKAAKADLNPFGSTSLPNNNWGYGKLDMNAINAIFAEIK